MRVHRIGLTNDLAALYADRASKMSIDSRKLRTCSASRDCRWPQHEPRALDAARRTLHCSSGAHRPQGDLWN